MYDNVGNIFCCSDEKIMAMMRKYATGKIEADIYPVYTIGKINCGNDEKRNSHCGENRAWYRRHMVMFVEKNCGQNILQQWWDKKRGKSGLIYTWYGNVYWRKNPAKIMYSNDERKSSSGENPGWYIRGMVMFPIPPLFPPGCSIKDCHNNGRFIYIFLEQNIALSIIYVHTILGYHPGWSVWVIFLLLLCDALRPSCSINWLNL